MYATAVGAFLGALCTLLISMAIEYQRKPKLRIFVQDPPRDVSYQNKPASEVRFLNVVLEAKPMPAWLRWLGREAALHCTAEIQFLHFDDGAPIFTEPMPARWSASDEPI